MIKKSCYNCEMCFPVTNKGIVCANTYYGKPIVELEEKYCKGWNISLDKYLEVMKKLKDKDKQLHDYYLYQAGINKLVSDYFI